MRYWCLVTSKKNWEVCKKHNLWGVDYRYFVTLKKFVRAGDKAIVYSHGGDFVAEVEITSGMREEFTHIGLEKRGRPYMFPYRVDVKIIREGEIHISDSTNEANEKALWVKPNFIDELIFLTDKGKTWNQYLQASMINISKEDFERIASNLHMREMDEERAKRVTIDIDEVIFRSNGSRTTIGEFVKEMLYYNPLFHIEVSPDGETWYLKRRQELNFRP